MTSENDALVEITEYASPPCFMHEVSAEYGGTATTTDSWVDVSRWRKAERRRQLDARLAMSIESRSLASQIIADKLDKAIGQFSGKIVSGYWPVRGEPDLRNWAKTVIGQGGQFALPVVTEKNAPLEFRVWAPGDRLERGVWNILVPTNGPSVRPDVVIAPVVGFDEKKYRLGYGGGYFDRTLAALPKRPLVIGIGYARSRIATIFPQPHDIPMDLIITDQ